MKGAAKKVDFVSEVQLFFMQNETIINEKVFSSTNINILRKVNKYIKELLEMELKKLGKDDMDSDRILKILAENVC
jgi:hypothetical protein